jgi:uncharacterized protein YodC (DUF2158 family)
MEELKIADLVTLNSGGPKMSVTRIIGAEQSDYQVKMADEYLKSQGFSKGDVICQWFEGNKLSFGTFRREALIRTTK